MAWVGCHCTAESGELRLQTRRFAYLHLMKLKFGVCCSVASCLRCTLHVASCDFGRAAYACGGHKNYEKYFKRIALSHRRGNVATCNLQATLALWHEWNFYNLLTSRSTAPQLDCLQLWQVDKRLNPNLFSQTLSSVPDSGINCAILWPKRASWPLRRLWHLNQ